MSLVAAIRIFLLVLLYNHEASVAACHVIDRSNPQYQLEGAELQYKLFGFFEDGGPPPLDEVFWTTQGLSREGQDDIMRDCPGLLICAFLMVAETRLHINPREANDAFVKAVTLAEAIPASEYEATLETWPIRQALESYQNSASQVKAKVEALDGWIPTVQFVVCHCRESLNWLVEGQFHIPQHSSAHLSVFIYEKCGERSEGERVRESGHFENVYLIDLPDGPVRRDECVAYLQHLVDKYDDPANYTLFFQADAGDHMEWDYLNLVMQAVERHTLQLPFVHLNHPRLVSSLSDCKDAVFKLIFDRSPSRTIGSYCCAQFAVSRQRLLGNPKERYEKMLQMLDEPSPPGCHDIPGHSTHCLMYEVLWHVLFGENDELPSRHENQGLPLFLRVRDVENESYLPRGSMYLKRALED